MSDWRRRVFPPAAPDPGVAENGLRRAPPPLERSEWYAEITKGRWFYEIGYTDGVMEETAHLATPSWPTFTLGGARRRAQRHLRRRHGPKPETWYVGADHSATLWQRWRNRRRP